MNTLEHHVLVFDEDCPLCRAYTGAFIKSGMLGAQGRESYRQMSAGTCALTDRNRARNEIALVNTQTGQVTYGVSSLARILSNAVPALGPVLRLKPLHWLFEKMYRLISYNRRVIMPSAPTRNGCVPDVRLDYRWAYLILSWLFTSFVLSRYSVLLQGLIPPSRFFREFLICGGQIVFQGALLTFLNKAKRMDYLGSMMTISLAGALVLLPVMWIGQMFGLHSALVYAGVFMLVAGLMLLEHLRRMRLLGIHWSASAGWVAYRLIVLGIITV